MRVLDSDIFQKIGDELRLVKFRLITFIAVVIKKSHLRIRRAIADQSLINPNNVSSFFKFLLQFNG